MVITVLRVLNTEDFLISLPSALADGQDARCKIGFSPTLRIGLKPSLIYAHDPSAKADGNEKERIPMLLNQNVAH